MDFNHVDIYELYVPNFYDILNRFSNSLEFAEKELQRSDMSKSTLSLQLSWMKSTELQFDQKRAFTKICKISPNKIFLLKIFQNWLTLP